MNLESGWWIDATEEGKRRLAQRIEAGERIAIISGSRIDFVMVSRRDQRALSALESLSPETVAALLPLVETQKERKAIIRLIDWIENELDRKRD